MAQERTVPQQTQGEAVSPEQSVSAVPTLLRRLEEVRAEPLSAERELACARLNAALLAVPQLEDREAAAAWMLQQLDAEAFHGLIDDRGVGARACAVEAVLAVGYPVALQLEPEDIEYYREAAKSSRRTAGGGLSRALLAAGLGHASAFGFFLYNFAFAHAPNATAPQASLGAAAVGIATTALMTRLPVEGAGQWGLRAVAAVASATLLLSFSPTWVIEPGGAALLLATLVSASAGLLTALAPRPSATALVASTAGPR